MNINLLIFAIISVVILFPIIYFLPLKMSPKGKMIVIAISFLISLTALFTKVFFQIWQSVLLIILLLLLVTMAMKRRFTPFLYSTASPESAVSGNTMPMKEDSTSDVGYEYIPVMNSKEDDVREEIPSLTPVFPDLTAFEHHLEKNESSSQTEEIIGQLEEINPSEVVMDEDNALQPVKETVQILEELETEKLFEDSVGDDISVSFEEVESDRAEEPKNEEVEEMAYLAELEEMMMSGQMEDEDSVVDKASEVTVESDSFADEWDELLKEVELAEPVSAYEETAVAIETPTVIDDFEDAMDEEKILESEELASELQLEELEDIEAVEIDEIDEKDEEPILFHENEIESIEDVERTNTFTERTDTILENDETAVEEIIQNQPIDMENPERVTSEHREVFQTILLQAEIAKKVLDPNQYEQFLQSHMNDDRPAVECFTMASMLIEHYINIGNYDALLQLLGQLEDDFSQFPILLQEIHYLQAHYTEK